MMEFDVFISYSARDKTAADAACAVLEGAGIRCWIAPRDIRAGSEYGAAIVDAIDRCHVMVLIFSSSANQSHQIHREIERAVSKGVPIVPVRIEEVVPTESMEYFLGAIHWLDALTPPIEKHLQQLAETVRAILQAATAHSAAAEPAAEGSPTRAAAAAERFARRAQAVQSPTAAAFAKTRPRPVWLSAALAVGACIILLVAGVWYYRTHVAIPVAASIPVLPTPQPSQPAARQPVMLVPETVPFISDHQRILIRTEYLPAPDHKALAISYSRAGFVSGQVDDETAKAGALEACRRATEAAGSKHPCRLYAVGNIVVFAGGTPPLPPAPWLVRNPAIERPFASKDVPLVSDADRAVLEKFYAKARKSKALALSPGGLVRDIFNASSVEDAIHRALEICGDSAGVACTIVAIDDVFVVPIPVTMKVTGFFNVRTAMIPPAAREVLARRLGNATNAWNAVAVGGDGGIGVALNAANEEAAIRGALDDCSKQDRGCRVIALGPFLVAPLDTSK